MKDEKPALLLEKDGPVVIITNNDAPMNRMTLEFIDALEETITTLAEDNSVRVIIIRGAGEEHFSVGMHLKQLGQGIEQKGSIDALLDQRLRVLSRIEQLHKPVIAVLRGYCLGGGLELPLACHFRLAAEHGAKIGLPELDIGTVPAWGGTARLARCVGRDQALDIILRAKKISGPKALEIGLVQEVWPNAILQEKALELAHELAAMPPWSVAGVLQCVVGAEHSTLDAALAIERQAVHKVSSGKHQMEGMLAFLEKRDPDFSSDPE
ncbi:MAG: enoyl-CoA hydratase/isomerase family protein [Halioglobus sp.]|nr:enoyl-CoA hydratase/isomerase family protein [Halioglobus sp.]